MENTKSNEPEQKTPLLRSDSIRNILYVVLFSIITTLMVWAPFLMRSGDPKGSVAKYGFDAIYRNYDGFLFVIPAKTNYRSDQIENYKVLDLKASYYAAHMPGYSILIKILGPILGYLESMLYVNLMGSAIMGCLLYIFYKDVFQVRSPLFLAFFTLLIPRLWILRSTGSSEIIFMVSILASAILLSQKKYILSGAFAFYASFTRIHGIIWGVGLFLYFVYMWLRKRDLQPKLMWPIFGALMGFVGVCLVYLRQYGDFFAYFQTGAVVPSGFIYSQFDSTAKEIKSFFLEDILFYFVAGWLYITEKLDKSKDYLFFFVIAYFGFTLTIQHRDIARYLVPIIPVLIGSSHNFLEKKTVRWAWLLLLPAVYWYVVNFMSSNIFLDSMKPFM